MTDKSKVPFAVGRFNERTYQSGGVVAIIKGVEAAKKLSLISIGVRARKTEGRVGAISWRKLICAPEWTRRRLLNFDRCGSIFNSLESEH